MVNLKDKEFIVNKTTEKWVIIDSYDNFFEYSKYKINAKQNERERFSIFLILFNINRFETKNLLCFIPDFKISELINNLNN